ncbi:hypothetical protein ACWCQQ_22570 [Streptomyces sp. NPDC002143]
MDPATLGVVAAALVATKFGEGFASEAGRSTWVKIQGVAQAVRERLGRSDSHRAALAELDANPEDADRRAAVAVQVQREAESDPEFAARLFTLVGDARTDTGAQTLIAHASGNAQQINIAGNSVGPITFS